jgi:hypothetical protein
MRASIPFLMLSAVLMAQQPIDQPPLTTYKLSDLPLLSTLPTGDARFGIKGTVRDAESGEPIPQAVVTISRNDQGIRQQFAILTDQAGGFEMRNMPAGSYDLHAARAGYSDSSRRGYLSSGGHSFYAHLGMSPDQTVTEKLFLSRQSLIQGTVLDSRGAPISGSIVAFRLAVRDGRYLLQLDRSVNIDSTGSFRLAGLRPGEYYIGFRADQALAPPGVPRFSSELYPGVPTLAGARVFNVAPGKEEQIHFHPSAQPAYEIRGSVPGAKNGFSIESLASNGVPFHESFQVRFLDRDGTFSISGLFPGDYALTISESPSPTNYVFHVGAGDATDVPFIPIPKPAIQGRIRIDAPLVTPPGAVGIAGQPLAPKRYVAFNSAERSFSAQTADDNSFVLDNILPGNYQTSVSAMPPEYVKSIRQNGHDLLRDDLVVTAAGAAPIEIVIGQGSARVKYSVADPETAPASVSVVALRNVGRGYKIEQGGALSARLSQVGAGLPGQGSMDGLPPGDYIFLAWNSEFGQAE